MTREPEPQGIRNVVGVPVRGADFFDREEERALIWRRLETNHVLLPSPRRVGKTSLMRALATEAKDHGYAAAVYVDVAGASDEREFVAKIVRALSETPAALPFVKRLQRGPLARLLAKIQSIRTGALAIDLRDEPTKTWRQLGDELVAAWRGPQSKLLVLCDELGIFVQTLLNRERQDPARARAFMTWLRDDVRQDAASGDRVRWLVASSVGLPTLTDLNNIGDTINDFELVPVGPFKEPVADLFLAELARGRGVELEPAVRQRIIRRVGWPIPYFLQVFFAALTEQRTTCTVADVDATFERLLGVEYRSYFDWWSQRLAEELGRSRAHQARSVLTACAHAPDGVRGDTLRAIALERAASDEDREWITSNLFDVLESDGYWVQEDQRYRFRSNLLREYWRRRHPR